MRACTSRFRHAVRTARRTTAIRSVYQNFEAKLHRLQRQLPQLPDMQNIAERSRQEIERLDDIFASGTVDQKKEFVAIYVKTIEADPNAKSVKISLFPALFSQIIAGGGFEPPTSGL